MITKTVMTYCIYDVVHSEGFLLVVKPSVSGSDWPSLYKAKMATEYSMRDASSLRSYEFTGPTFTCIKQIYLHDNFNIAKMKTFNHSS